MDLSKRFSERLRHEVDEGEMRDGAIRYLMMRPDALMGMFARLEPESRAAAYAALAASVAEFGGRSVAAYRESGALSTDSLMKTIEGTSADLGWGRWTFSRAGGGAIRVEVRNSPFADGAGITGEAVCAPIRGILTAMASVLVGQGARVEETVCASAHGAGPCCFTITPEHVQPERDRFGARQCDEHDNPEPAGGPANPL